MSGQGYSALLTILALSFGLITLWLPDAWPFAILQILLSFALFALFFPVDNCTLRFSFHPLLLLPLAVATLALLQFLSSQSANLWETRRAAIEWFTFATCAFLAYNHCRDHTARQTAVECFALGSSALCLLGVIQNYSAPGRVWWIFESGFQSQVFGPFIYHTKFANFAQLGLATAFWSASKRTDRTWLYLCAAAVLFAAVVVSASRGGVLVISLEALLLFVCYARRNSAHSSIRLASFSLLLLTIAIALLGADSILLRLKANDLALDSRWAINAASLDMAATYFWSGSGLGTWSTVYPEFARFDIGQRINQAHNDWLQWLIEGGIALLLLVLSIWLSAVRTIREEWWSLGFVFVWLHGFFDYPMQQTPAFAALQFAFWGAALATLPALAGRNKG